MTVLDRPIDTALSKDRLRLWLKLLKVTRGLEAELRERMRLEFGSTLPRFDVMAALARHPDGLRMSALSDVLRVSNGNVTGIVDRLVAEGQVARAQVPGDRRAQLVRLTPEGRAEFAQMARTHEAWVNALLGDVDAAQASCLLGGLGRLEARPEPGGECE
ncbi:MAG: MarR family transcriptional regulator [Pseudomonadota bacterium]